MLRKFRRILCHNSIKKFLDKNLEKIGLGKLIEFKCECFRLGKYSVVTSKGKYEVCFWESVDSAKEFRLLLGENEIIIFSVLGLMGSKIEIEEMIVDRKERRQVVNLSDGTARLYVIGEADNTVKFNHIEFKKPFMESEYVNISDVLRLANVPVYLA